MTFITTTFGQVSTDNSSTLSLASTGTYTGSYENVKEYSEITISVVIGSSESATLTMESSIDAIGTNKITKDVIVTGSSGAHTMVVSSEYFRIILGADQGTAANGAVQTIYHKAKSKSLTEKVGGTITDNSDAEIVKSVMVGQDPNTGDYTNISINGGSSLAVSLSSSLDAFGRIQVSNPISLLASKQQTIDDPYQVGTLTSGSGTTSYTSPFPHTNMQVLANGDRVVRQSKMYSSYQPGKAITFLLTGTLLDDSSNDNIRARIGAFDDLNDKTVDTNPTGDGFFFQLVGSATTPVLSIVHRSSNDQSIPPTTPPTQTDTTVLQSSWNIDKLDGTGQSGYTIDVTKRQIFSFSLAWLGTGDVVCGVYNDNKFVPCHRFHFTNGETGTNDEIAYSTRGSLPFRYELEATGVPTSTATMRQVCSSVSSDGGFTPEGAIYAVGLGGSPGSNNVSTTEGPLLSLRLNQTATAAKRVRAILNIIRTKFIVTGSGDSVYYMYLFRNPTQFGAGPLTGASFINQSTDPTILDSAAEYDISATAVDLTGVTYPVRRIEEGFFSKETSSIDANLQERIVTLVSDIAGNSDLLVITMQTFSGNQTASVSVQWQEYE